MLTQCPSCQTTFRVTLEILRVADGQVRCGRCQTQFDALERLMNEDDVANVQSGRFLQPPASNTVQSEPEERPEEEIVEEWIEIEDVEEAAQEQEVAEADEPEELLAEEVEAVEPASDEPIDEPSIETEADEEPAAAPDEIEFLAPGRSQARTARIWKILAAPLALLLIMQVIHSNRHELARHPQLGPAIMSIYRALGVTLRPDWDLHAYEILQWHVGSDPAVPGTLKVRANLRNVAKFPQPYPLLKLVLEDRWGEQVRAREFDPKEYLDPAIVPDRLLAAGQQATATIAIVDPGPDAEGFRFDVCLRGAKAPVCAADVPQ